MYLIPQFWNIPVTGRNSLHLSAFQCNTDYVLSSWFFSDKVRVGTENSLSQRLNWVHPPSCVAFTLRAVWLLDSGPRKTTQTETFKRSYLFICLYRAKKKTTSAHQTQGLPVITERASWEHHMSGGSHQTEQKRNNKEGVSAEGRERTGGWSAVGGELLLRRGMIFLRLYILGLYLTWSSGNLQEQQLWAQLQRGREGFEEAQTE